MKYVKQEQKFGCVFACIAMILETDYWSVRNEFPEVRFGKKLGESEGIDIPYNALSYLFHKGYVGHTSYSTILYSQQKREPSEWIKEFAPIHLVSVISISGYSHACVWKDGVIYDPSRLGKYTIKDYREINSITGFWNIE